MILIIVCLPTTHPLTINTKSNTKRAALESRFNKILNSTTYRRDVEALIRKCLVGYLNVTQVVYLNISLIICQPCDVPIWTKVSSYECWEINHVWYIIFGRLVLGILRLNCCVNTLRRENLKRSPHDVSTCENWRDETFSSEDLFQRRHERA